ncbi:MAG TPA: hypothetical protein DEG71_03630 [Clostridiales bacterium]|nr:hypothetical protein [Clostridiales bacterium]
MIYKCKYFNIKELVSDKVYNYYFPKYGENFIWSFFDESILKELDIIRETWNSGIKINDWHNRGQYRESGLRCNIDSLVKSKKTPYVSAHVLAKGFDLKPINGNIEGLRKHVENLIINNKLKLFRRIEDKKSAKTWVHVDSFRTVDNKLEIFSA